MYLYCVNSAKLRLHFPEFLSLHCSLLVWATGDVLCKTGKVEGQQESSCYLQEVSECTRAIGAHAMYSASAGSPCWCQVVARPAVTSDHGIFYSLASPTSGPDMSLVRG